MSQSHDQNTAEYRQSLIDTTARQTGLAAKFVAKYLDAHAIKPAKIIDLAVTFKGPWAITAALTGAQDTSNACYAYLHGLSRRDAKTAA